MALEVGRYGNRIFQLNRRTNRPWLGRRATREIETLDSDGKVNCCNPNKQITNFLFDRDYLNSGAALVR